MPENPYQELIDLLTEQRALIKQGHELLADLTAAIRQAKVYAGGDVLRSRIETAVEEGLARYEVQLENAIKEGTDRAMGRFDFMADLCLGEDAKSERLGKPKIVDLLRAYIAAKGLPYKLIPTAAPDISTRQEIPPAFRRKEA